MKLKTESELRDMHQVTLALYQTVRPQLVQLDGSFTYRNSRLSMLELLETKIMMLNALLGNELLYGIESVDAYTEADVEFFSKFFFGAIVD